ncbi:lysophosphatidic acid receptor 6 [Brachyhypopomus gauderio]|uniref:lysophosphatidic acid receptor 6 n=1 Tax=Brachyhypopomus gauderio TaxID=698409 RepID=UPI0040435741
MDLPNDTGPSLPTNCTLDMSYRFTYYQVSYSLIFVLSLASNGPAVRHLWLGPRAQTSTAVYMANLAAVDLFFAFSFPLRIYYYHNRHRDGAWSPGSAFCGLTFALKYVSLYGGIFFLACIGLDRYLAVVQPLRHRLRGPRAARALSVAIWWLVWALSLAVPTLLSAGAPGPFPCLPDPSAPRHRLLVAWALGLVQAAFLLPALALVCSYGAVVRVLRGKAHRLRRRRRALTVIYAVLGVFLLCFAPYHVNLLGYTLGHLGLVRSCGLARLTAALHPVLLSLASANCCLNPLVYYFSSGLAHGRTAGRGGRRNQ